MHQEMLRVRDGALKTEFMIAYLLLFSMSLAGASESTTTTNLTDYAYGYDDTDSYAYPDESGSGDYTTDEEEYVLPDGTDYNIDEDYEIEKNNQKVKTSVEVSQWFSCDNSEVWLTKDKQCDGVRDCFDCSDEFECANTHNDFFYCYDKGNASHSFNSTYNGNYSISNPFCIPRHKFCDGIQDCTSGTDEKQVGFGFKCQVKNHYRTCILPEVMIGDDVIDCEDKSDMDEGVPNVERFTSNKHPSSNTFQCVSSQYNISIFQNQVCDGVLDCPDLSDECLCQDPATEAIRQLCSNVCWQDTWTGRLASGHGCTQCDIGQVLICNVTSQSDGSGSLNSEACVCLNPADLCSSEEMTQLQSNICNSAAQEQSLTECLSIDGSFHNVRAVMCDGRPECFFGEDECVSECFESQTYNQTANYTGHFCSLLVQDGGYQCGNQENQTSLDIALIHPCDGIFDCASEVDEIFCPTRYSCIEGNDVTSNDTSSSANTCDTKQVCVSDVDCAKDSEDDPRQCSGFPKYRCEDRIAGRVNGNRGQESARNCAEFSILSSGNTFIGSKGLSQSSTKDDAIQYGLLVLAAIGTIGNLLGVIIAVVNSVSILKTQKATSFDTFALFYQESVFYTSVGVAKTLFCVYVTYVLLRESRDQLLCTGSELWRTDGSCEDIGGLAFIGANSTWFILLLFVTVDTLMSFRNQRSTENEARDKFLTDVNSEDMTPRKPNVRLWVISAAVLLILSWAPMVGVVIFVRDQYDSHAWVDVYSSPSLLNGNIMNRTYAMTLAERTVTIYNDTSFPSTVFSWQRFDDVISATASSLGFHMSSVLGYYSYAAACLPLYLARPANSENREAADQFSFVFMVVICVVSVYVAVISAVGYFRKRHVEKATKEIDHSTNESKVMTSNYSVVGFVIVEILTWLPIFISYFVNLQWPGTVTDHTYQTVVLCALALNCGPASVYLHLWKRRVYFKVCAPSGSEVASNDKETSTKLVDQPHDVMLS